MRKCREIYTNHGSPEKITYKLKVLPDGTTKLVEAGKENIQEYIQSFADSTDINNIMTRLANGDVSVLNKSVPQFGDFTGMPSNLAEFMQLEIDCKNLFDSLPIETKKQFDMDKNKFLAQAGGIEWFDKVKDSLSPEIAEKVAKFRTVQNPIDVKPSNEEVKVTE